MIEVRDLTKRYKLTREQRKEVDIEAVGKYSTAVNSVSFDCRPGRVFTLLGPNGAGKTTILRMIATLIRPSEGAISVCGHDTQRKSLEVRKKIGFLTGSTRLYDRLTPRELVRFCARTHGMDLQTCERREDELFSVLGMNDFANKRIGKLSTGMTQKASIARTMIHDPDVVVFDEPTAGLDVVAARTIVDIIRRCREQGKTVLFSTHIMGEVSLLSDDLAIIHKGRLIYNGTYEAFRTDSGSDSLEEEFILRVEAAGSVIYTIFKKELLDIFRDRRTLFVSMILPILILPVLIAIAGVVVGVTSRTARSRTLTVALSATGQESRLRDMLLRDGDLLFVEGKIEIREDLTASEARRLIEVDSLDCMIQFDPEFDVYREAGLPGRISFYYKESGPNRTKRRRVERVLNDYRDALKREAYARLGIDPRVSGRPVEIDLRNLASNREVASEIAGRIIPYFFIIFCLVGCMHPAMDLTAGEKERGTFETLLTLPATRFQILLGKFFVVLIMGMMPALLMFSGVTGMAALGGRAAGPIEMLGGISTLALTLSLLFPLVVLCSALIMSISIYSKSYKEAQSYLGPGMLVVIAPIVIGLLPGVELTNVTSIIPVLNISLATRSILAGSITAQHLFLVYGSLIALALLSLWLCSKMFERESAVFRS